MEVWLAALEASALGVAAREWVWLYPLANVAHVLGVALLVGGIATYDVALLRRGQAPDLAGVAVPLAMAGAALALGSGAVLLAADATALGGNTAFWLKLGLVALGGANAVAFHLRPLWTRAQAALSLLVWVAALSAGRLIAYV